MADGDWNVKEDLNGATEFGFRLGDGVNDAFLGSPKCVVLHLNCTPNPGQPGGGVFFMKYTLEFKLECVERYKRSHSYVYPLGIKSKGSFRSHVLDWVRLYDDYLGVIGLMA